MLGKKTQPLRAVVSGATSFIGSAVVNALLANDYEVFGLVRRNSQARDMLLRHDSFHEVNCDIAETEIWTEAIGHADIFYHFAWGGPGAEGRANAQLQYRNALNTLECIRASAKIGVSRFLFAGSQAEYGVVSGITTEETPCNPILEYGKNKLYVCQQAPHIAEALGIEYIHARIFSVYGPKDHPYTLVPSCIRCFLTGDTMELSTCTQKWNFLHVRDAARILVLLGNCDLHGHGHIVVNVAGSDTRILRDFVEEIHALCGYKGRCAYGDRKGMERPVDNWPDIGRLRTLIDWNAEVPFQEGIKELIRNYLREKGE